MIKSYRIVIWGEYHYINEFFRGVMQIEYRKRWIFILGRSETLEEMIVYDSFLRTSLRRIAEF